LLQYMRLYVKMVFKLPKREQFSNKSTFGKVLNIAGSEYYTGAAYLSSISALKTGCGYVALSSSPKVIKTVSLRSSDIVFLPIAEIKQKIKDFDVISIGCGLSTETGVSILFKSILETLSERNKAVIIDADGLNLLSKMKNKVDLPENLIITPHPKEASRLLNADIDYVLDRPMLCAKELTKKYHCTTVLKMHSTVVCSPELDIYVNNTGNSALSKAGSGDVLTGMIAGLCAQKMTNFDAAKLAVYLHGKTGEIASGMLSEYSVLASDLLKYIPLAIIDFMQKDDID
ncbi:MAG: NAD(P)H-hydrate dehydratase, partial [Candidatus Gastranaerophilales bacterium]|nr:NAD(P)H-hydrate dehydratase [Candidatus Gastranaerophilales bacterium]